QVPLPRRAWLGLAGLLANCRRSAPVVVQVLTLFLGAKVTITQLVGAWQNIERDDRIALGRRNHQLGRQSLLGRRVWDQQARVRLDVAPLDYAQFSLLLPPNKLERLARRHAKAVTPSTASYFDGFLALLRLLLDRLHDCEVHLQVNTATVPASHLTARPQGEGGYRGLRLGQTAWLSAAAEASSAPQAVRKVSYVVPAYDTPEAA
ncbi:MAG TPA: type VI secretion system baseplate subunit TssG, partial [Noviherbaspirillum sp.]|nr:type VI secretion system baseplate subunit TssG [Noviherbaspirillum sp.]